MTTYGATTGCHKTHSILPMFGLNYPCFDFFRHVSNILHVPISSSKFQFYPPCFHFILHISFSSSIFPFHPPYFLFILYVSISSSMFPFHPLCFHFIIHVSISSSIFQSHPPYFIFIFDVTRIDYQIL